MATARQFLPEAPDSPEPLTFYAGAPTPGHVPSAVALAQAYVHFRSQYHPDDPEHRLILDGAARAFTALQERPWTVLPDGTLELAGSTGDVTYQVSDSMCRQKGRTRTDKRTGRVEPALCPSFQFAQRRHGGACYHIIARELLRLAQVIDNPQAPPAQHTAANPDTPFVTLSGRLLGLACGIARLPEQPVTLIITDTILTLLVGNAAPRHTIRLTGDDGHGDARIRLTADAFADLWLPFRPVATSLTLVTLFIDRTTGQVLLAGDQFTARSQGDVTG
jgi:hypothetical protein